MKLRLFNLIFLIGWSLGLISQEKPLVNKPNVVLNQEGDKLFVSQGKFSFPENYQEAFKDYRNKWTRLTNYEFSGLHWKQFIVIYVNKEPLNYVKNYAEYSRVYLDEEEDEEAQSANFIKYPEGTIFLKEHYVAIEGKPAAPVSTVIMKKREKGYDSKNGDWEYAQFAVDGSVIMKGDSKAPAVKQNCAACHKGMAERDYIFASFSIFKLKK